MNKYNLNNILPLIDVEYNLFGKNDISIEGINNTRHANTNELTFVAPNRIDKQELYNNCNAGIIICDKEIINLKNNCLNIIVVDPRLIFSIIANTLFIKFPKFEIHPTAVIHPEAIISKNCFIGANCSIGKVVIDENVIIYPNVCLYDNISIGKNVIINANTTIGAEGFGYNKTEDGIPIQFPHIGGVIIEDDVHIGANTCIDRGALGNTILKKGCKIDNLVHIAHNVVVGEYAYIIANAMIGGSTIIGDGAYIAPSVSLRDGITIGKNSLIGMAAVGTKNIPNDEVWMGSPAKFLKNNL